MLLNHEFITFGLNAEHLQIKILILDFVTTPWVTQQKLSNKTLRKKRTNYITVST